MTNVSVIPSHREQNTVPQFVESSNDIDDVIETIERLRLASRQESRTGRSQRHSEPVEPRTKSTFKNINDYEDSIKGKTDDRKGTTDHEQGHDDKDFDSSDESLIERGPTRSQPFKCTRSRPYQDRVEQLDPFLIKVTGQILRDKECREKLEPCLRKLERANGYWVDGQNEQPHGSDKDGSVTNESLILENVLNSTYQVAQRITENNFIGLQKRIEDSSKVVPGSESHSCSPASSPEKFTPSVNQNYSFSTEVASGSPYRSMQSLSSYPSNGSPSSSTQSYGDAASPISVRSGRTSIGSQISERLDDFRSKNDRELLVTGNPVPNSNNELWLSMDEFLKSLDGENDKEQSKERDRSSVTIEGYNDASWNVFQSRDNDEAIKTFSGHSPERSILGKKFDAIDFEGLFISDYLREGQTDSSVANDGYNIPSTVTSIKYDNYQSRESKFVDDRGIPWSSLYLPTTRASERLMEKLNVKKVERAMASLLKKSPGELVRQDNDGDTMLMCLVGNPEELQQKLAYLIPFVDRLSTIPGALAITNSRGEDALYLAALNCPELPFVAGYLAATMIEKGIDVGQRLYRRRGDTLIHSIAAQGVSHKEILAELLAISTAQGNGVFDLSKRNYDGKTALHVAIESHDPLTKGITSVAIVRLLLKHGADPSINETKCGDNALHMAVSLSCDPTIVKLLLDSSAVSLVNATNYYLNTPLHAAAANSNVPLERQIEVCSLLVQAGSQTNAQNRQGKTPLALASSDRKEAVRKIFYRRS